MNIIIFGYPVDVLYLVLGLEFVSGILFMAGWWIYTKNRFTAYICTKYLDTLKIVAKIRVKNDADTFNYKKDKTYNVDWKCAMVDNKNKGMIFYLKDAAEPIKLLKDYGFRADSRTFRIMNDGKVLQHASNRKFEKVFIYIIAGLIVLIAIIAMYALYNSNLQNEHMIKIVKQMINATKARTGGVIIP